MTVFRVAFERWVEPANEHSLHWQIHEALDELRRSPPAGAS